MCKCSQGWSTGNVTPVKARRVEQSTKVERNSQSGISIPVCQPWMDGLNSRKSNGRVRKKCHTLRHFSFMQCRVHDNGQRCAPTLIIDLKSNGWKDVSLEVLAVGGDVR